MSTRKGHVGWMLEDMWHMLDESVMSLTFFRSMLSIKPLNTGNTIFTTNLRRLSTSGFQSLDVIFEFI